MSDRRLLVTSSCCLRSLVSWDANVYVRIFLDWTGFDREAKRHFLTAFLISLAFFVESCICDGHTRAVSPLYINRSRQTDMNWN